MTVYVAMLRAVNVGGHNKLAMSDLRRLLADAGAETVRTYIQSGNAVFRHGERAPARLAASMEQALAREVKVTSPVVLRTLAEMEKVLGANPLLGQVDDPSRLFVTFLTGKPAAPPDALLSGPGEEIRVQDREVYLYIPGSMAKTKLGNAFLEAKVGGAPATTRNWATVTKLVELGRAVAVEARP